MNETCKAIEKLKEIVKMFIEAQTEINDLNNGDFENLESKITELEEKLTELDHDIHKIYEYMERLENRINGVAEFAHSTDRVVRAICVDLDNKRERKEYKRNAPNK